MSSSTQNVSFQPVTDETNWYAVIHFYQVFSFLCFAGFITFLILYLVSVDETNIRNLNPNCGTDCSFSPVSQPIVKNNFNDPYSMVLDQTTGTLMMATFTSVLFSGVETTTEVNFQYHNFLYTLLDNGNTRTGFGGINGEVAPNIPFNTNTSATVEQTVVSSTLNLITNGTYLWDIIANTEFQNDLFIPPSVPETGGGTQTMEVGSVQEWSEGVVVQYVVSTFANSPMGSQARLGVFTSFGGGGLTGNPQQWSKLEINPLSPTTAGLGQFGLNRISVGNHSIVWGTDPPLVLDYDGSSLTWSTAPVTTLTTSMVGAKALALTRNGKELFVLTSTLQLLQYARLSVTPSDDTKSPQAREFTLQNSYETTLASNSSYQLKVNATSLIVTDQSSNVFYYRRPGLAEFMTLDQTIDLTQLETQAHQTNLVDLTQNSTTTKKTQFLVIPWCERATNAECGRVETGRATLYHDSCQ